MTSIFKNKMSSWVVTADDIIIIINKIIARKIVTTFSMGQTENHDQNVKKHQDRRNG